MDSYLGKRVLEKDLLAVIMPTRPLGGTAAVPTDATVGDREAEPAVEFDRAGLLARLDGSEEYVEKLLSMFGESVAEHLLGLTSAVQAGDCADARYRAHTIAGSAANIGAVQIEKVARDLELSAKSERLTDLAGLCLELQGAFARFRGEEGCAALEKK